MSSITFDATLVVDDAESLIETLKAAARRIGIKGVEFFTSLADAERASAKASFRRYIADQVFEGENSGIDFLEEIHQRQPDAELILLTGKHTSPHNMARLRGIGASHVRKSALDTDLLALLLAPTPLPVKGLTGGTEIDIAELRLRHDQLVNQYEGVRVLNDLFVEDIVAELTSIKKQQKPAVMIAGRLLSAADLRHELQERTEIGRELIRLHHDLNRRLRAKG